MVSQPILDRLVCAKYLFENSTDILRQGKPYAAGMAVLGLQDAAEMVLRAIAEHLHAPVKESAAFNQLMDDIDKLGVGTLSHRSGLIQLNKARVNFKHVGLEPREEHVRKFRADLADFFAQACNTFLQLDFEKLSLTALIGYRRSRNWIEHAEQHLEREEYEACITATAIALRLFQRHWARNDDALSDRRIDLRMGDASPELMSAGREIAERMTEQFELVHEKLDLVAQGVSYNDFRRFSDTAPWVSITLGGIYRVQPRRQNRAEFEDGLFCLSFVRNLILKIQGTYRSRQFAPRPGNDRYRLLRPAQLIVYPPKDGESAEVVDLAPVGAEFDGYGSTRVPPGYVGLFYQEECVYVLSDAVEKLSPAP